MLLAEGIYMHVTCTSYTICTVFNLINIAEGLNLFLLSFAKQIHVMNTHFHHGIP